MPPEHQTPPSPHRLAEENVNAGMVLLVAR